MISVLKKVLHFSYVVYAFLMFFLLMILVAFFVFFFIFFPKTTSGNCIYKVCEIWAVVWFTLIGIKHKIIFEENATTNEPVVFVANHQSYMDIPVSVHSIRMPYRILGKSEMAKVPIFGFIYKKAVIMVDRSDKARRGQSYLELRETIHKGLSVLVYPEGTFNETGKPLKSFYDGAFKLALNTQTDIQPMIILDTLDRLHYKSIFSLRPGLCRTVFLPKIPIDGFDKKDYEKLKTIVFDTMNTAIERYMKGNA